MAVNAESLDKGIPLTPVCAEYAAAARMFHATIWLGHHRNMPRWAIEGRELAGVRWQRLSDIVDTPTRPVRPSIERGRSLMD